MNNQRDSLNTPKRMIIKDILLEAWQLVSGLKWPVCWVLTLLPTAYFIVAIIITLLLHPRSMLLTIPFFIIAVCTTCFVMWCTLAIVIMLGVRQAIGLPIDVKVVYSQCMEVKDKLLYLFLIWMSINGICVLVQHVLIPSNTIGMILNIALDLITLYCTLPLMIFALPLIVTKRCDLQYALENAYNIMNQYWFVIIACYVIMMIISAISAIPLGIGLLWTIPMYYAMAGVLFRNAYGLKRNSGPSSHPVERLRVSS